MKDLQFTKKEVEALQTCIRLLEKATVYRGPNETTMEIELRGRYMTEYKEVKGICKAIEYIFGMKENLELANYQSIMLARKLYKFYFYLWEKEGKAYIPLQRDYWFPAGEPKPRIKFLKEALDQHFENEKANTISKMGYSLLLSGVCLIGSGLLWEVSDRVSSAMLGAGAGIGSVGLFVVLIIKWIQNEEDK